MYLKLSYGTTEYTTEFITSNSSYKLEEIYYNDLAHADNSCSVKIPFNVDIQNFINAYSDNSILAQVKNTDGTNIFTGYVRKNYDFSKAQKNQALSLELVSPSFLLDVDTTQDIVLENTTLDSVVNALLTDAKFSTATLTSLSSYTISIFTLDEGSNVKTTLDNLLQQYGFTFDFDKNGNFYVATLFSDIPTDKTTITQIFDGTNSIDEIKVEKKEQEYNGVNLSWTEYKNISNKLIFADTTNGSVSDNTCSIELEAGKYLTSGNDDDTGTSYYIAYDSSEGDIIYIDSATLTLESSNNSGLTYSFTNLGKKGELSIYNKSSATITITKINVNGSGYVKGSENQTKTTTGKKFKDITGDYIHDSTNAKKFAQNYCDWQNYADYKISLKSNSDFALGSFVKISEYGLGTLYGRIINKNYKLNSPIEYKIEAISEYEKAETTNYFIKNYKQGITGATGKGIYTITEYYLASESSSGISTSSTGWTTTIQTITTTKKYLWNYEVITYTDGSTSATTPCIIGTYGATGEKGDKGDTGAVPQYLGIGLIADVNGLTTKAYTGATITDTGVITPNGATTTAVIPGDWLINYSTGTYCAKGIYYWSGSAWMITSDSKYTSDGVIEDICRLNNGGILIPDWTVYVNLIADNLFSHTIKLTTKTISGVTYAGVFYGGERFNADGSIADRSKNGFYFKTDGKGWCNLQSDDLYNTIIGTNAGLQLVSGSGNLGRYNSICGSFAGSKITTGYTNSLFGSFTGQNLTTGYNNSLFGSFAGSKITTGANNSLFGKDADVYNGAWNYQINLNNRIMYLEFARNATQDTVYKAITHYIVYSAGNVECVGAMGRYGVTDILKIVNNGDNNIDFYSNGDDNKLTATSGSSTQISKPLQVAFIVPAEPTNK